MISKFPLSSYMRKLEHAPPGPREITMEQVLAQLEEVLSGAAEVERASDAIKAGALFLAGAPSNPAKDDANADANAAAMQKIKAGALTNAEQIAAAMKKIKAEKEAKDLEIPSFLKRTR